MLFKYDHEYVIKNDLTIIDFSTSSFFDRYIFITEIFVNKLNSEIFIDEERYDKLLDKNDDEKNEEEKNKIDK